MPSTWSCVILVAALIATMCPAVSAVSKQCQPADMDDFKVLPGYTKLLDAITKDFGRFPSSIDMNTQESHPIARSPAGLGTSDMNSMVCMETGPYDAVPSNDPSSCSTNVVNLAASYQGIDGNFSMQFLTGSSSDLSYKVTNSARFATRFSGSVTLSAEIKGKARLLATIDVVNKRYQTGYYSDFSTSLMSASVIVRNGQNCTMHYDINVCRQEFKVMIPISFEGWIQLGFDKDVTYQGQDSSNKHKYWWVNVVDPAYGLTKEDFTGFLALDGDMTVTGAGDAYVNCDNGATLPAQQEALDSSGPGSASNLAPFPHGPLPGSLLPAPMSTGALR